MNSLFVQILLAPLNFFVKLLVSFSPTRWLVNKAYLRLPLSQQGIFRTLFVRIFKNSRMPTNTGYWNVLFAKRIIRMPLNSGTFHQDWAFALNLVGLEQETKKTYESLLLSPDNKPQLFIDIGTNYGTHSLLFLVHQIETISIEPNYTCYEYFDRICRANNVSPILEKVALSDRNDIVELTFPEGETWLGTVNKKTLSSFDQNKKLTSIKVTQKTLDDYYDRICGKRALIKIDTEGNEASVIFGGHKTLSECKPLVIFESWGLGERKKIFLMLTDLDYDIFCLPWIPAQSAEALSIDSFTESSLRNFIACPKNS